MNQLETAHRNAVAAVAALFKDHHDDVSATRIKQRLNQALEALATFSAAIALQQTQPQLDPRPSLTPPSAIPATPPPPKADR